jgi:aminopeptidase N
MDKWTQAVGYPVVSVQEGTKGVNCNLTLFLLLLHCLILRRKEFFSTILNSLCSLEGEFHITQKRFLSSGPVVNEEDDRTVWWVNLAIRSSNLKTPKFVTIKGTPSSSFFFLCVFVGDCTLLDTTFFHNE